jgi:hypothetical protein
MRRRCVERGEMSRVPQGHDGVVETLMVDECNNAAANVVEVKARKS